MTTKVRRSYLCEKLNLRLPKSHISFLKDVARIRSKKVGFEVSKSEILREFLEHIIKECGGDAKSWRVE